MKPCVARHNTVCLHAEESSTWQIAWSLSLSTAKGNLKCLYYTQLWFNDHFICLQMRWIFLQKIKTFVQIIVKDFCYLYWHKIQNVVFCDILSSPYELKYNERISEKSSVNIHIWQQIFKRCIQWNTLFILFNLSEAKRSDVTRHKQMNKTTIWNRTVDFFTSFV